MKHNNEAVVDLVRLNALSDGIFGVALTLLVVDIRIPENVLTGELSTRLLELAPKLLIYLISFIVIGAAWSSHQRMLSHVRRGDGVLVWLNLLSLLFVTLMPAASALLGRYPGELIAIVCFAVNVILIQLTALWLWRHAAHYDLLNTELDDYVVRSVGRRLILIAVLFGLCISLFIVNTNLVYLGWVGIFALMLATDWLSWQQVRKITEVAIPLDGANQGQLSVLHGAGRLIMAGDAGSADVLVQGTCHGEVSSQVEHEGDRVNAQLAVHSGSGLLSWRYPWAWEVPILDWELNVNRHTPLSIEIQKAGGELALDFTSTRLTALTVLMNKAVINLRLPANAGQTEVRVQGLSASLELYIPEGVAAYIQTLEAQASLEIDVTRFPVMEDGSSYRSPNYESASNRVDIQLGIAQGTVRVI